MTWKRHLAAYLAAKARHDEAERLYHRASRTFIRLADKHGADEKRAYLLAGVGLADERSLRAYQEMMQAFDRLKSSLRIESTITRLAAQAAVLCAARAASPANDDRPRRRSRFSASNPLPRLAFPGLPFCEKCPEMLYFLFIGGGACSTPMC